ncbi:XrtA/PEP-CTERM system TPR-repeat protein PrsT [Paracraurococcus lichenis]|uniref:PEP-CTERM system TPR-repeat protein PrsT n=1 Tax=Paracraurococcus lichenis TaxID=3064888 RepID=A0ABT9EA71_9PROT|nr:XrtA/PEP-CTERM system TPR-repeat protein PrsT [Paracraurococcus sp. LOR1-02]MDO9713095.1 PEP-CTERM system TPR-repeat protein PrsT [Paracraurococcus sp. LOR1-02]
MATPPNPTRLLLAATLALGLGAGEALAQPLQRARAAEARGDLRAAQIEYRNAVRAEPQNGAVRAGLAEVSMELGDVDTAEREARAALDGGYDPPAATALLIRTYAARGRFREILRDFPLPENPPQPAVAGQVAVGRALAHLALGERDAARAAVAAAQRLAPGAVETHLAVAGLALADGDRAASEAAIDRVLAVDPARPEALLRKASFQFERGERPAGLETLGRLVAAAPGNVAARLLRAEMLLRTGEDARARQDVEAALRVQPGSVQGVYTLAVLQARAQDFRAADETLQRLGAVLPNIPEGLLLLATVKRALNQASQAEDAAQRYNARRPEDPRGAKLLATLQAEGNRPGDAAATLTRLVQRGGADAEAFDMLGRLHGASGRPREAVQAFQQAAQLAPGDSAIQARLAAARLAAGDAAGTQQAAGEALRIAPGQAAARELLAIAALSRGDVTSAQAEWDRLSPEQRRSEPAGTLEGLLKLARFDVAGARTAFETVLRSFPDSVGARLGLARVATAQGQPEEAERLLGEVLARAPGHPEALGWLAATIAAGGPRGAAARVVLQRAQAAAPNEPALALALAGALAAAREPAKALAVLNTEALRRPGQGPALPLARSQAHAALEQWAEAEAAARLALAEDAASVPARRQLLALLLRAGKAREAETLVQEGLRQDPGNPAMQALAIGLAQQTGGLDAALAAADRLADTDAARPASLQLRGELLLGAQRPAEAARAFAAMRARADSAALALREAMAWRAAGNLPAATAAVDSWLARAPEDAEALNLRAQLDMQAGRDAEAERRLQQVVERAPDNAVALNNLAWLLAVRGGEADLARARGLAERAYFLLPNSDTADTFGWILARTGDPQRALVLLRQAVAAQEQGRADPGKAFRLAGALRTAGERAEAIRLLEPVLAAGTSFPERAQAERLLAELRAGR